MDILHIRPDGDHIKRRALFCKKAALHTCVDGVDLRLAPGNLFEFRNIFITENGIRPVLPGRESVLFSPCTACVFKNEPDSLA